MIFMKEQNNQLYILDKSNTLYVFDLYGSLIQTIELKDNKFESITNGEIFASRNGKLLRLDRKTYGFAPIPLPFQSFEKVRWRHKILFQQEAGKLHRYSGKF